MVGTELSERFNEILGDVSGEEYAAAQVVVEAADTVREAVEAGGVLERLDSDAGRAEARAVLELIPAALDQAIIAALESVFERRLPVHVAWQETRTGGADRGPHLRGAAARSATREHRVRLAQGNWFLERLAAS